MAAGERVPWTAVAAALEPFRTAAPSDQASEGAGVSLSLTKALVEANGALLYQNELDNWHLVTILMSDETSRTVALGWHDDKRMADDYKLVDEYLKMERPYDVKTAYTNEFLDKNVKMPPIIGAAIRCITSEPVPWLSMIGSRPAMITATVIALGRTRMTAPSSIAAISVACVAGSPRAR